MCTHVAYGAVVSRSEYWTLVLFVGASLASDDTAYPPRSKVETMEEPLGRARCVCLPSRQVQQGKELVRGNISLSTFIARRAGTHTQCVVCLKMPMGGIGDVI